MRLPNRQMMLLTLFFTLLGSLWGFGFDQPAEPDTIYGQIEPAQLSAGSKGTISVTYVFPEGYHQTLQEDFFYFEVQDISGIEYGDIEYPEGKMGSDDQVHFYGETKLVRSFETDPSLRHGIYTLHVNAGYQMCEDSGTCLMPQEREVLVTLEVTGGTGETTDAHGEEALDANVDPAPIVKAEIEPGGVSAGCYGRLTVTFSIPRGYHQTSQEDFFYIEADPPEGFDFREVRYPGGEINAKDGLIHYKGDVTLMSIFKVDDTVTPGTYDIPVMYGYQICLDTGSCLMPEDLETEVKLTVKDAAAAAGLTEEDVQKIHKTATTTEKSEDSSFGAQLDQALSQEPPGEGKEGESAAEQTVQDILWFLLMALVGGIILNIMPCVLPVLSIKAMHLVNQSQQNRSEIMKGSLAYTAGILVSFLVLGLVVVILKTTGESVGWGFQFQNIGFSITLGAIVFVFSLSLFDIFVIAAPGMGLAARASSKGGHWGSFLSGIFAVLLATPCTAPFLGAALGFAFSQPPLIIMLIFLMIGIGLAFPFILLAFWPRVIRMLPKPGEWMNIFKEVMGFLLIGTALYVVGNVYNLVETGAYTGSEGGNFLRVIWFFVILAFTTWIYGRFSRPEDSTLQQWIALIVAVALTIAAAWYVLDFEQVPYIFTEEQLLAEGNTLDNLVTDIQEVNQSTANEKLTLLELEKVPLNESSFSRQLNQLITANNAIIYDVWTVHSRALNRELRENPELDPYNLSHRVGELQKSYQYLSDTERMKFNRMALELMLNNSVARLDWTRLELGEWRDFSPALVQKLRDEGLPVFIDFGADWCATCRTNESVVLHTESMMEEFASRGVVLIFGDYTNQDPVITEWLQRYQRAGVPLYLLFRPGEDEPVVLPEILTSDIVLKELEKLPKVND